MSRIVVQDAQPEHELQLYQLLLLQNRAARSLKQQVQSSLVGTGLTFDEWSLLCLVRDQGRQEVSMQVLADILKITAPSISLLTSNLLKKRILKQKLPTRDLRQRQLALTGSGRRLLKKCDRQLANIVADWHKPLLAEEFASYTKLLTRLSK